MLYLYSYSVFNYPFFGKHHPESLIESNDFVLITSNVLYLQLVIRLYITEYGYLFYKTISYLSTVCLSYKSLYQSHFLL